MSPIAVRFVGVPNRYAVSPKRYALLFVGVPKRYALGETGRWLAQVYRGWQGYYGVSNNGRRLQQFRNAIFHLWLRQIRRRSQKGSKWTWARMGRLMRIHLPKPRIVHPWPHVRFHARSKGGAV